MENEFFLTNEIQYLNSPLYKLEPKSVGEFYIESLTSYLTRLAEVHCKNNKNHMKRGQSPL